MRSTRFAVRGLAVATALTLALAACDDDEVTPPPQVTVTVAPANPTIQVGGTVQLSAAVNGSDNQSVTWASDDQDIATVNTSSGLVTGVNPGQVAIRATSVAHPSAIGFASVTVTPPPAIEVTVTPSEFELGIGGTRQLVAQVSGTTNQSVTWSSDDEAVAQVSSTGLVTGVGEGTTLIRATSAENSSAVGSAAVTVLRIAGEIVIQSITLPNGNQANPANISGQIGVTVEFTAPQGSGVTGVEVAVRDADGNEDVVCSQSVGGGSAADEGDAGAQAVVVCTIITDAFDAATGAARFANGLYTVIGRLVTSAGTVNAEAGQQVTFNNADGWVVDVAPAAGPAADDDGRSWYGGDVVVTGIPVLYSGNTIDRVTFEFLSLNKADDDGSDGFQVTYSKTTDLPAGTVEDTVNTGVLIDNALYTNGQAGPDTIFEYRIGGDAVADEFELRIDNQPPDPGTFDLTTATLRPNPLEFLCCTDDWVGAAYVFADGKTGEDDLSGVGIGSVVFYWGEAGDSDDEILQAARVLETGADIPESQTNTAYRAIAVVTDRVGNQSVVALSSDPFGVDHGAPELGDPTGPEDGDINPLGGALWDFDERSDTLSGFVLTDAGIVTVIGNFSQDNCIIGDLVDDECLPVVGSEVVDATTGPDGYYTLNFSIRDKAGNTTAAAERTILIDGTGPTVSGPPVFPGTVTGGAAATFGIASIADDVDLESFRLSFRFGATADLPMGPWEVVGDGFGGDLVDEVEDQEYTAQHFIRSIELTDGGNAPDGTAASVTEIFFLGRDVAGNVTATPTPFAFAGGVVPAGENAGTYAPDLQTFHVESSEGDVCDIEADGSCGSVPQSTTLSAVVTGPSGSFTNPYARVWFYRVDVNTGVTEFIGEATSANQDDDGNVRTFTYTFTLNGAGLGVQSGMEIFAVAVTSDGDALLSQNISINVVQ